MCFVHTTTAVLLTPRWAEEEEQEPRHTGRHGVELHVATTHASEDEEVGDAEKEEEPRQHAVARLAQGRGALGALRQDRVRVDLHEVP